MSVTHTTPAFSIATEGNGGTPSPSSTKVNTAVIPVGGLGTRMFPTTFATPKNLLNVASKTLIEYAVEEATLAGCDNIIIICSPQHRDLYEQAFGNLAPEQQAKLDAKPDLQEASEAVLEMGRRITFIEQESAEGLGHAIYQATKSEDFPDDEPFAVILPDDLIIDGELKPTALADMVENYHGGNAVARMRVEDHEIKDYGSFAFPEGSDLDQASVAAIGMVEKQGPDTAPSREAVIGRYILSPEVMEKLADDIAHDRRNAGGEFDITAPIAACCEDGQPLYASTFNGTRFDCGKPEGLEDAQYYVAGIRIAMRNRTPEAPIAESERGEPALIS